MTSKMKEETYDCQDNACIGTLQFHIQDILREKIYGSQMLSQINVRKSEPMKLKECMQTC